MFRYYNANAQKNFVNDCVIRAVSTAEGKSWDETYIELSTLARKKGLLFDDVNFVEPLLDSKYKRVCYQDMTVGEFVNNHLKERYLLTMKGHISCCIDGILIDTWDCSERKLKCAWKVM